MIGLGERRRWDGRSGGEGRWGDILYYSGGIVGPTSYRQVGREAFSIVYGGNKVQGESQDESIDTQY